MAKLVLVDSQSKGVKLIPVEDVQSDPFADTASEMSGMDKFLAGAGGGMKGIALGLGQRLSSLPFMPKIVDQAQVDDHLKAMKALNDTGAGLAGNVVGSAALLAPTALIPGANSAIGAPIVGALTGMANPTGKDESVLSNMVLGAGGGYIGQRVGNALGTAIAGRNNMATGNAAASASSSGGGAGASTTVSGGATARGTGGGYNFGSVGADRSAGLTQSQRDLLQRINNSTQLNDMGGFRLTPGQASGSRALQQFEAKLESQPMTSGTFNEIKSANQRTLNRAVAASIGEASDVIDSSVLNAAHDRIGNVYQMVADRRVRQINPDDFLNTLGTIETQFEGLANISHHPLVNKLLNYAANGQATGEQLQQLSSQLGKSSRAYITSPNGMEREMGMALGQVRDHVDELLQQGLSGDTARAFADARRQYRNLMLIESRGGIINPSNGNVSGANLANALQAKDKVGFLRGRNESAMYDAARFAQSFKPLVGDSGTATRMPLPTPTDFVLSLPFNIATRAYASAPVVNAAANVSNTLNNGLMQNPLGRYFGTGLGGRLGLVGGGLLGQAQ